MVMETKGFDKEEYLLIFHEESMLQNNVFS